MAQMQDEAGNIWEVDEAGNVLGLVRPASSPPQGRVFTLPQSPKEQRQEAREANVDADRAADNARADRSLALQEGNAALERELKRLQIMQAQAKAGGGPSGIKKVSQLVAQINRVQELYDENIGATKGVAGLQDYLPTNENARFDTAGAQLSQIGLAAFRTPGTGTVSDRDAIMFDKGNLPTAATRDAAIEEILGGLRRRVEEEYQAAGQPLPAWTGNVAQQRADSEVPDPATGALPKDPGTDRSPPGAPPENGDSPPDMQVATGDTGSDYSARLSAQVNSLINAGAGESTINVILKEQGYPALKPGTYAAARKWMRETGKRFPLGNTIVDRNQPLSMIEKAAASPYGAATANFTDAITAGTTTAIGGDKARGALDAMKELHPGSSLAGMAVGGVLGAAGAETGLAARAPAALARFAPRIADALYGGLAGFNAAEEGEGGQGALFGAGAGVLGGSLGDRAARAVGAVTTGVRNPAVQVLRDRGIPLTVGQTVGDSGTLGRTVKGVEDALTSVPGVGNMIDARRIEGLAAFNRAAFQDAAAPGANITATGSAGMGQVRQSVGDAYGRALDPVTIDPADPQFGADLMQAVNSTQAIPPGVLPTNPREFAEGSLQSRIDNNIDPDTGLMSGRNFQEAYRGLGRDTRSRANGDYAHEVGSTLREGQDALAEVLERQNPGAFEGFLEANAANRRANVLAQAMNPNAVDELITPAQLNRADFNSTSRLEGRINAASGNRPFYELANAGQQVLPSQLPDSGTAKRAIVGALTTGTLGGTGALVGGQEGAGYGTGGGLALTAALMGGGTRMGQRALTAALTERPDFVLRIAEQVENNPALGQILLRLAGGGGAAAGASLGAP